MFCTNSNTLFTIEELLFQFWEQHKVIEYTKMGKIISKSHCFICNNYLTGTPKKHLLTTKHILHEIDWIKNNQHLFQNDNNSNITSNTNLNCNNNINNDRNNNNTNNNNVNNNDIMNNNNNMNSNYNNNDINNNNIMNNNNINSNYNNNNVNNKDAMM